MVATANSYINNYPVHLQRRIGQRRPPGQMRCQLYRCWIGIWKLQGRNRLTLRVCQSIPVMRCNCAAGQMTLLPWPGLPATCRHHSHLMCISLQPRPRADIILVCSSAAVYMDACRNVRIHVTGQTSIQPQGLWLAASPSPPRPMPPYKRPLLRLCSSWLASRNSAVTTFCTASSSETLLYITLGFQPFARFPIQQG